MGGILGKCHGKEGRAQVQALNRRIDELEAKLRQVTYKRACEKRAQVRREAAWSRERAQMQEQLDALSECWAWCREGEGEGEGVVGVKVMAGMMREEQARHDEAVERWKRLYLAIKSELDHLVQRAAATSAIVPTPTVSPKSEFLSLVPLLRTIHLIVSAQVVAKTVRP
ncbi:hypothetical protein AMTR_s00120p00039070 [Amborella trichopoda]|uniref:Uncharacterized protein n=1 Tax=Amborella trichopoda TaxID=13333 RepID=W1NP22_AMBTC|nr:hypothetical protein AMTR_s00120p00039070 [Amborella trichopoda]